MGQGLCQSKSISSLEKELSSLTEERKKLNIIEYASPGAGPDALWNDINEVNKKISSLQIQLLQRIYTLKKNIPKDLRELAYGICLSSTPCNLYKFCNDPNAKVSSLACDFLPGS